MIIQIIIMTLMLLKLNTSIFVVIIVEVITIYSEQCPHVSTMDYVEDAFVDKVQANFYDNSFNLSWNHEHYLFWDPNYPFPSHAP